MLIKHGQLKYSLL